MSKVDQFESLFRAATKQPYKYQPLHLHHCLLITDMNPEESASYLTQVRAFAHAVDHEEQTWSLLHDADFRSTGDLLDKVTAIQPDVLFTYRNLHSEAWRYKHSLGEHLDVLLQRTEQPVIVMPHPHAGYSVSHAMQDTNKVMAVTDHMVSDSRLVNYARLFTQEHGELYLAHIEDEKYFQCILAAISKIPSIDTDNAEHELREQLLKEPMDYIKSVQTVLHEMSPGVKVVPLVEFGHSLKDLHKYVLDDEIDLLAMRTKEDDQLAMHGMTYPLAIEIRQIPLLML